MSDRDVRYCTTSDGVRIAYCVEGEGETSILALPVMYETFSLDHLMPVYQRFYRDLRARRRVIRFDTRGTGLSEAGSLDVDGPFADLEAVADAAGGGPYAVWASTTGGPAAINFAASRPELVSHLILYGAYAALGDALSPDLLSGLEDLARADWETANQTIADLNGRRLFPEEAAQLGEWYSRSTTLEQFVERRRLSTERPGLLDATEALSQIQTPTLVLHRIADPTIPLSAGQKLAAGIENAQLVTLEGEGHLFCLGDYGPILRAVDSFLGDGARHADERATRPDAALPSGTAVILFADIADSTALTERLGDAAFREKARSLDESLRSATAANSGTTIEGKLLGDGVLATFGAAREAIACARVYHGAADDLDLALHVGIHAGDVIHEDGNVFGGAVNIAARVSAEARAGETLVSTTVRDLARTSAGVAFEDRGERELKGVAEPVRVFAIRSSEEDKP